MITAELKELLQDADCHQRRMVTVYEYRGNKVGCCCGELQARPADNGLFLGTDSQGYYVNEQHVIIKEVSRQMPRTISYRILQDDVELLNIMLNH